MKRRTPISRRKLVPWFGLAVAGLVSSCASEGVQKRVDRRNAALAPIDENMRIRQAARDERIQRSRDRILR